MAVFERLFTRQMKIENVFGTGTCYFLGFHFLYSSQPIIALVFPLYLRSITVRNKCTYVDTEDQVSFKAHFWNDTYET